MLIFVIGNWLSVFLSNFFAKWHEPAALIVHGLNGKKLMRLGLDQKEILLGCRVRLSIVERDRVQSWVIALSIVEYSGLFHTLCSALCFFHEVASWIYIFLTYQKIYIYFINRKSFEVGDVSKVFLWNDVWCLILWGW